jgi:hypothetical protein
MDCDIFNKSLALDIRKTSDLKIDLTWLKTLIPSFDPETSGIWQPIWVKPAQSKTADIDPLYPARSNPSRSFSPCNCNDNQISPDPLYQEESKIGLCSYCNNTEDTETHKWRLYDVDGNASPREYTKTCCGGGCDTKAKVDDYIPKIPYLNHAYITGFTDFKYHQQFPASNNPALGCDSFIKVDTLQTISGASLCVDWRIRETISEIPYNPFNNQHDNEHMHNMSYLKNKLTSATCGNFILLSLPSNFTNENYYSTK